MSLIKDLELFRTLSVETIETIRNDKPLLIEIIGRAITHKVDVVTQDEFDNKLRLGLNFGHTIGHAIEAELDGQLNHGLCVSIGMLKELEIASLMHKTSIDLEEITEILKRYDLPVEFPDLNVENVIKRMSLDKKKQNNDIPIIVPRIIGQIPDEVLHVNEITVRYVLDNDIRPIGIPTIPDSVEVSGSKSITNRVFLLASLAHGTTIIKNALISDDTKIMIEALRTLTIGQIFKYKD